MNLYTSESVCAGHPDKICDQISDAVLDEALRQDPFSRVAVETMVGENICILMGEVTSSASLKYEQIARQTIKRLGYDQPKYKFSDKSKVEVYIHEQSAEIAQGVDDQGAGDQGMMYGYACRETPEYMPVPIALAHQIARAIDRARDKSLLDYLRPDGKVQVTINYEGGQPKQVEAIVVAVPHDENIELKQVKADLLEKVISPILSAYDLPYSGKNFIVNGTGVWHLGGPAYDSGLTGRKIIVDTYGGIGRIGGGAFSGKDPTKVDRSAAYAARFLAKNIVAQGLADKAEVRLAYYIGAKQPVMQEVETFGSQIKSDKVLRDFMNKLLDTSVAGIINELDLRRPIYLPTAAYGHFGKPELPWEEIK